MDNDHAIKVLRALASEEAYDPKEVENAAMNAANCISEYEHMREHDLYVSRKLADVRSRCAESSSRISVLEAQVKQLNEANVLMVKAHEEVCAENEQLGKDLDEEHNRVVDLQKMLSRAEDMINRQRLVIRTVEAVTGKELGL